MLLLVLVGCGTNETRPADASGQTFLCPVNTTPTLFLYPATDYESVTPRYFNNTEYEIFRNGEYLGKFKGDRYNHSFLNLSVYDVLDILVSAESSYCYVPKEVIYHNIPCNHVEYITPQLRCVDRLKAMFINTEDGMPMLNGDRLISNYNRVDVDVELQNVENYRYIGCSYDQDYIEKFIPETKYSYDGLVPTSSRVMIDYDLHDLYELVEGKNDYTLNFYIRQDIVQSFNTTVSCYFFDEEYYIKHYSIKRGITDGDDNLLGQEEVSFNFTIRWFA